MIVLWAYLIGAAATFGIAFAYQALAMYWDGYPDDVEWWQIIAVPTGFAIGWPVFGVGSAICLAVTAISAAVNRFKLDRWLRSQGL